MTRKLTRILVASMLGTVLALAPAFGHGGGGGGGHGGGGGGRGGGMGIGGGMGMGGGMGGRGMGGAVGGRGGVAGRSAAGVAADPRFGGNRFGATAWTRAAPRYALHGRFLHHRRFGFFGAPYYSYYDDCWQSVWTAFGAQWVNVCGDYYGSGSY